MTRPLAIIPFLLACPSFAEVFPLSNHENWSVAFVASEGDMPDYCTAQIDRGTVLFSLDVTRDEGLRAWVIHPGAPWADSDEGVIYLWTDIHRDNPWTVEHVQLRRDTASFLLASEPMMLDLLAEVMSANFLFVDYNVAGVPSDVGAVFPLAGAQDAIIALADCAKKLNPAL